MTVIVALPDRMLSDSKCSTGDTHYPTHKIFRERGELIGVAGKNRSIEKFMRWYRGSRTKMLDFNEADEGGDSFTVVVVNKKGIWLYDDCSLPDQVTRGYAGCGTGWPAAWAAILMGGTANRAIEIACEVSNDCGLPVREEIL